MMAEGWTYDPTFMYAPPPPPMPYPGAPHYAFSIYPPPPPPPPSGFPPPPYPFPPPPMPPYQYPPMMPPPGSFPPPMPNGAPLSPSLMPMPPPPMFNNSYQYTTQMPPPPPPPPPPPFPPGLYPYPLGTTMPPPPPPPPPSLQPPPYNLPNSYATMPPLAYGRTPLLPVPSVATFALQETNAPPPPLSSSSPPVITAAIASAVADENTAREQEYEERRQQKLARREQQQQQQTQYASLTTSLPQFTDGGGQRLVSAHSDKDSDVEVDADADAADNSGLHSNGNGAISSSVDEQIRVVPSPSAASSSGKSAQASGSSSQTPKAVSASSAALVELDTETVEPRKPRVRSTENAFGSGANLFTTPAALMAAQAQYIRNAMMNATPQQKQLQLLQMQQMQMQMAMQFQMQMQMAMQLQNAHNQQAMALAASSVPATSVETVSTCMDEMEDAPPLPPAGNSSIDLARCESFILTHADLISGKGHAPILLAQALWLIFRSPALSAINDSITTIMMDEAMCIYPHLSTGIAIVQWPAIEREKLLRWLTERFQIGVCKTIKTNFLPTNVASAHKRYYNLLLRASRQRSLQALNSHTMFGAGISDPASARISPLLSMYRLDNLMSMQNNTNVLAYLKPASVDAVVSAVEVLCNSGLMNRQQWMINTIVPPTETNANAVNLTPTLSFPFHRRDMKTLFYNFPYHDLFNAQANKQTTQEPTQASTTLTASALTSSSSFSSPSSSSSSTIAASTSSPLPSSSS